MTHPAEAPSPPPTPPAIPWIQALGIVAIVGVAALDSLGPPDFDPPVHLYFIIGAAIIGLGPEEVIRLLTIWKRGPQ